MVVPGHLIAPHSPQQVVMRSSLFPTFASEALLNWQPTELWHERQKKYFFPWAFLLFFFSEQRVQISRQSLYSPALSILTFFQKTLINSPPSLLLPSLPFNGKSGESPSCLISHWSLLSLLLVCHSSDAICRQLNLRRHFSQKKPPLLSGHTYNVTQSTAAGWTSKKI